MHKNEVEISIDWPLPAVSKFVTRIENDLQWLGAVTGAEQTGEGEPTVGTVGWTKLSHLGWKFDVDLEVIEYDPERAFAVRSTSGLLPFTARWSFEEEGSGTKFRYSIELKSGMFGIFGMYKRNMKSHLKALKELLEKGEAA